MTEEESRQIEVKWESAPKWTGEGTPILFKWSFDDAWTQEDVNMFIMFFVEKNCPEAIDQWLRVRKLTLDKWEMTMTMHPYTGYFVPAETKFWHCVDRKTREEDEKGKLFNCLVVHHKYCPSSTILGDAKRLCDLQWQFMRILWLGQRDEGSPLRHLPSELVSLIVDRARDHFPVKMSLL